MDLKQKKKAFYMVILLIINAFSEILGLAAIIPLIPAMLDPKFIEETPYVQSIYKWFNFSSQIEFLFFLSVIIFILFVLKNILSLCISYIQSKFAYEISLSLSERQFHLYYKNGYLQTKSDDSGKKIYKVRTIPYMFASAYIMETLNLTTELVVVFLIFLGVFLYAPQAILLLVAVIIPTFSLLYYFTRTRIKILGEKMNSVEPKLNTSIFESLNAIVDVKLYNKEAFFLKKYRIHQIELNKLFAIRTGIYQKISSRFNDIIFGLGIMLIFGLALSLNMEASSIIYHLGIFGIAAYRFLPSVTKIMNATLTVKNYSYLVQELAPLLNQKSVPFSKAKKLNFKEIINLENIFYEYPNTNKEILKGITLSIKKGETLGIIGSSGSGKTTLINIILQLLVPTKGRILLDGKPIEKDNQVSFQKLFSYVQQSVFILDKNLARNVAFGEEVKHIDQKKLTQSIKSAMLESYATSNSLSMTSKLGENGENLSGGQKQRIGIARALYKNAEIIIFDEPTSALDTKTEKEITKTIKHLSSLDKTIIIIAHRISTLQHCDRVIQLEQGKIVKEMSYEEIDV